MQKDTLYPIGQFMALTHVTKKTLRYYDEHDILKPSFVSDSGARFYSQEDVLRLQQILLLKYLGFSLSDIREMMLSADGKRMEDSLSMQKKLVEDKIEQLKIVSRALEETSLSLREEKNVDWSRMLHLIQTMNMEQSLLTQYQNASNIASRIDLHTRYSTNPTGWFPWIFQWAAPRAHQTVLELGCGDGSFWTENRARIPEEISIRLSDVSQGMLRDAKRNIGEDPRFHYHCFGVEAIPFPDESFDLILANHVLFYSEDLDSALREIRRVLRPGGVFLASTYGHRHMQEISALTGAFDSRIVLSEEKLFTRFGKENGEALLRPYFSSIQWNHYEDQLYVTDAAPLISYILSCHGNQNQYILERHQEFRHFLEKAMGKGLIITKDAGLFLCR